jgi:hypothetical protein
MGVSPRCNAAGIGDQRRSRKPQVRRGLVFEPNESDYVAARARKGRKTKMSALIAS